MGKHYKTKADFDDAVAAFKSEHRSLKATVKNINADREELIAECEKQVGIHAEECKKLHKWVKELKAEIKDLKDAPGTGLYIAKSSTYDVYIAANSYAAAEKAFETRHKGKTLESLAKLSDSFLA